MSERREAMNMPSSRSSQIAVRVLVAVTLALALAAIHVPNAGAQANSQTGASTKPAAVGQKVFNTPEEARDALVAAGTAKDHAALLAIFGSDYDKLRSSDPAQEQRHDDRFAMHLKEAATLEKGADGKYWVFVGTRRFPFPIPIVQDGEKWRFDTCAGLDEVLNRRIGENELSAIMTARAYVVAQWEYFTQAGNHNEDGLAEYAERFVSTPGTRDGLYWETGPSEDPSPMGVMVAMASVESTAKPKPEATVQPVKATSGATEAPKAAEMPHAPFHGYYFKILLRQGPSAPGGAFSYLINGHMIAGFALVAYPATWGTTGVMTFIVNTQGRVYQKNLGAQTTELAPAMREYNPDTTWQLVPKY